jgi:heptosyltransferase-2
MAHKTLIIKTGYSEILDDRGNSRKVSLGDVLRTTPLLHLYKDTDVAWLADMESFPLLVDNPLIKRILPYDLTTTLQLESEEFDTVVNLEKIPGICALADRIRARRNRFGFTFNSQTGEAEAYDRAFEVLAVSSDKTSKRENKRTSQELLFEMVGAKWAGEEYSLGYTPKSNSQYDVAINTFVGLKWPTKAWPQENWDCLEEMLAKEGFKVTRQDKQDKEVLTNLYAYMDWINSANTIVSSDSLGLHLGIALKKNVLAMFGPTPYREVHFYGRGEPILVDGGYDCQPCMSPICLSGKNCIKDISPKKVADKVVEYISRTS